jgi:hypothetical protein
MTSLPSVVARVAVPAARVRRTQDRFATLAMTDTHRPRPPVARIVPTGLDRASHGGSGTRGA